MNQEVPLSEKKQEYLGIINRIGEHLLSLINGKHSGITCQLEYNNILT